MSAPARPTARQPLRVLALIPARAGSKGLRNKNVRRLSGLTLLEHAVHRAKASERRGERWTVVVSTDSRRYATLAQRAGAEVPFLRPAPLASDSARLAEVVAHAITSLAARGSSFDVVVMLSPTTPLVTARHVRAALALYRSHGGEAVLSVVAEQVPPAWRLSLASGHLRRQGRTSTRITHRQSTPTSYVLNGAIYVATPDWILHHGQFFVSDKTVPYVMNRWASLDIESESDLAMAKLLFAARHQGQSNKPCNLRQTHRCDPI